MSTKLLLLSLILFIGTVSAGVGAEIGDALRDIFCTIANAVVDIAGAVASLVIVWAGVKWIFSADNPEDRNKAKSIAINALVGLIIIMIAKGVVNVLTTKNVC